MRIKQTDTGFKRTGQVSLGIQAGSVRPRRKATGDSSPSIQAPSSTSIEKAIVSVSSSKPRMPSPCSATSTTSPNGESPSTPISGVRRNGQSSAAGLPRGRPTDRNSTPAPRRNGKAWYSPTTKGEPPSQPSSGNQTVDVDQTKFVSGSKGRHCVFASQSSNAPFHLSIDQVRELWRRRQNWHKAEKSLTLQIKGVCRRLSHFRLGEEAKMEAVLKAADELYDAVINGGKHSDAATALLATAPLLQARKLLIASRLDVEKQGTKLVKTLPAAKFVETTKGLGWSGFFGIVGEAGDVGSYRNPSCLWKRMGLAVLNGERQRKVEGERGIEQGYSPHRRSLMWTIGDSIVKTGGPLRKVYDQRKAYENAKNEKGEYAEQAAKAKSRVGKNTVAYKCYNQGKLPPGHIHMRAKRYVEKRLLKMLWQAWRKATNVPPSSMSVPSANL